MAAPKSPRAVPTTTINASTPLLHAMRGDVYGEWAQVRIYYRGQLSGSFDVRHGDVDAVVKSINDDTSARLGVLVEQMNASRELIKVLLESNEFLHSAIEELNERTGENDDD